jgi:low temperature requirement protein LtrA
VTEATAGQLRTRERTARITHVELFFGLVYVFAVTQLSHYLLDHRTESRYRVYRGK